MLTNYVILELAFVAFVACIAGLMALSHIFEIRKIDHIEEVANRLYDKMIDKSIKVTKDTIKEFTKDVL